MDAKQRRQKARHNKVFSELREAKNEIVRLSREVLAATERMQPLVEENARKTSELHDVRVEVRECRVAVTRAEKTAREAVQQVCEFTTSLGEVTRENEELRIQSDAATKLAKVNAVAAKDVVKLRRRLANREPDPEKIAANRKAVTFQSL